MSKKEINNQAQEMGTLFQVEEDAFESLEAGEDCASELKIY